MKLVLTDRAKADLAALDRATRLRVAAAIQRLVLTNTGNIKKLQGIDPPEFRLRIGEWRIRFSRPDADTVRIDRPESEGRLSLSRIAVSPCGLPSSAPAH